jgi:hypothetical protein
LSNGTILVIGGETGSNAEPQPSLEILPRPVGGLTVVPLDWLARTDPNNLYPFVIVLPSTHLFIGKKFEPPKNAVTDFCSGYYNEARILDPVTFDTIVQLPNIPGSVNNCRRLGRDSASEPCTDNTLLKSLPVVHTHYKVNPFSLFFNVS